MDPSKKIGPLPVWGWGALAAVLVVWVRSRQKAAATPTQMPVSDLTPQSDYGPQGWPGQGALSSIPYSAMSTTAFQPPQASGSGSSAAGTSATTGGQTPLQILAQSGQPPGRFLPR